MRVRTFLRQLRGPLSISDVCAITGIARGTISLLERGTYLPTDCQVEAMLPVYGHPADWYTASVLRCLDFDIRDCKHCGDELDPDASASRRYHPGCPRRPGRRPEPALASLTGNTSGDVFASPEAGLVN